MEIEMPVLLAYAIEDSTDIFRISGVGGVEHPKPPSRYATDAGYLQLRTWTEKRTKLSVLEEVKPKRSLEATTLQLKLLFFGHFMIAKGSVERDIMLGQVAGYRRQGKLRIRWLDSIKEATGLRLGVLNRSSGRWGKVALSGGGKRLGTGNAQMWSELRGRQWKTTPRQ